VTKHYDNSKTVSHYLFGSTTDEQKKNVLFISHISSLPTSKLQANIQDEYAAHDMSLQQVPIQSQLIAMQNSKHR